MADLTDEQCDAFRRLPGSFNDMVRAIYRAGMNAATPPADAALADDALCESLIEASDMRWNGDVYIGDGADLMNLVRAALRARAVPEGKKYHDVAQRLYSILDDIDTAGDIAKSDDKLYRGIVERTQAKKRDYVVSCDGYAVTLADDSMLAALRARAVPEAVASMLRYTMERIDKSGHILLSGSSAKQLADALRAILSATDSEVKNGLR